MRKYNLISLKYLQNISKAFISPFCIERKLMVLKSITCHYLLLISLKPTRIGSQYFLYRHGTKCDHLHKDLKANEGTDRRNYCETGELTGSSWIKLHNFLVVLR